jgi:hypothetical protein
VGPIGGVYVYQDHSSQGAAELKYRPFGAASRPHSHAVAGVQSKGSQARCNPLRLVRILSPGEPDVLVAADESDAFGKSIRSFEEDFPYCFSDDGAPWTSGITLHRYSSTGPALAIATQAIVCSNLARKELVLCQGESLCVVFH